jgi:sulfur-oxidizing protein SoxY
MKILQKKMFEKFSFSISFFTSLLFVVSFLSPVNVLSAENKIVNPSSQTEQWENLKEILFSNRKVEENAKDILSISAPFRAEDAAVVPISIKSKIAQGKKIFIKKLYLLIDNNPTPVAGVFTLSPDAGKADIETRVRLEEYTYVRAVAELNDGSLHMVSKFVRASGGCSAPAGKDQEAALARMGKMRFRVSSEVKLGEPTLAQVMVSHPNFSGMQMDQVTRLYVPPLFVRKIQVKQGTKTLLTADLDFAISENPNIRFYFVPTNNEEFLRAEVLDSADTKYVKDISVIAGS